MGGWDVWEWVSPWRGCWLQSWDRAPKCRDALQKAISLINVIKALFMVIWGCTGSQAVCPRQQWFSQLWNTMLQAFWGRFSSSLPHLFFPPPTSTVTGLWVAEGEHLILEGGIILTLLPPKREISTLTSPGGKQVVNIIMFSLLIWDVGNCLKWHIKL